MQAISKKRASIKKPFTLYFNYSRKIESKKININILNNLKLKKIDENKFPVIKILDLLPSKTSLFETVLVAANDQLVNLFLDKKIKFNEISKNILKLMNRKEFLGYKKIKPKNIQDIHILSKYVRLKVKSLCV